MDERQAIDTLIQTLIAQIRAEYPDGLMRRDAHPKAHGCVRAEFTINADLPDHLRVGLFSEPRTYPCWVRFSNSGGTGGIHPDSKRDVRGMAIKLVGVAGEKLLTDQADAVTHDFVLASYPVFVVKDAVDFAQLTTALASGSLWQLFKFYGLGLRLHELYLIIASQQKCADVLGQQYWSMVPYKLGESQVVKYSAIPRTPVDPTLPSEPADDFLRDRLREHLATSAAVFDFAVQLQADPVHMPTDDARIKWNSPFVNMATVRIPPQTFESPAQEVFCENLSYTPWHAIEAHRPLGSINRARRGVYEAISTFRHEANDAPREEPTAMQDFT